MSFTTPSNEDWVVAFHCYGVFGYPENFSFPSSPRGFGFLNSTYVFRLCLITGRGYDVS